MNNNILCLLFRAMIVIVNEIHSVFVGRPTAASNRWTLVIRPTATTTHNSTVLLPLTTTPRRTTPTTVSKATMIECMEAMVSTATPNHLSYNWKEREFFAFHFKFFTRNETVWDCQC